MQSVKTFYEDIIQYIQDQFVDIFKENVAFEEKFVDLKHMGYFRIQYKYLPKNYELVFENDRNLFGIEIFDQEGAKQLLGRIVQYESSLSEKNVSHALNRLKEVLEEDKIVFYVYRDKKLYRKQDGQYRRVKDLNELG